MKWISPNTQMPKNNDKILFVTNNEERLGVFLESDQWDRKNMFCDGAYHFTDDIQGWMIAPKWSSLPSEDSKEGHKLNTCPSCLGDTSIPCVCNSSATKEGHETKTAPVQGFAAGIPWDLHLKAYDGYCKKWGAQQALIEGDCRGGFGTSELDLFIPGWREELKKRAQENSFKDGQAKGIPTDQEIEHEAYYKFREYNGNVVEQRVNDFISGADMVMKRLQENSRESRQEPSEEPQ